jgi:hypothetical protein
MLKTRVPSTGLLRLRVNAGLLVRRAGWVSAAALPFACSVYGPSDLQRRESGQAVAGQTSSTAGDASNGGTTNGGAVNHAAGTTGEGGSAGGGAPGGGALGKGGTNSGGTPPSNKAGEGGATSDGGSSVGGSGAGAGEAGAGGADTGEVPAIPGLVASYPCESANGAVLADTSGHGNDATLTNAAGGGPVGFSFSNGINGNALTLSPGDLAYVSLRRGMLSQLTQVTIASWVKLKSAAAFQRIFHFGIDTGTFMYLASAGTSGFPRFRISSTPLNKDQVLEGAKALPLATWIHVAVSVGDNGVSIYLDGAQIAQQAPAVLRPSDLGDTGDNLIGRSPFSGDPYLDGQIDEFRIYNRVLSPVEIGVLAKAP